MPSALTIEQIVMVINAVVGITHGLMILVIENCRMSELNYPWDEITATKNDGVINQAHASDGSVSRSTT